MHQRIFAGALSLALAASAPLWAQDVTCPGGGVTIQGAPERATAICEATAIATDQLASCNLYVPDQITIEVTQSLPGNCYGLYHCEEDLIQLLPVSAYETYLDANPASPFGHLSPQVFFDSILRHELAHAAMNRTPCPFDGCPASQEFVAYTMQIYFLPDADRTRFETRLGEAGAPDRPITRDSLNAMILMMAPEIFIENAYRYFARLEEPCALIGEIARGDVLLDLPFQ